MLKKTLLISALIIVVAIVAFAAGQKMAGKTNKFGMPTSIIHVVTFKWKAEATAEQKQKAVDGVKTMAAAMPGIKNIWLKTLRVQGPSQDKPFDGVFVIEFANQKALDAYRDHPAHKAWEDIYLPIREESRSHQATNEGAAPAK
jgi:hypothetical protein